MKKHGLVALGVIFLIISLSGCSEHGEHEASAVMEVSPSTQVTQGTMVNFDASDSEYSGDDIEWLLNDRRIGVCRHKETCSILMSKVGQSDVTLRVKRAEINSFGNVIIAESKDETTVRIYVKVSDS